jgi:hypothetical protein
MRTVLNVFLLVSVSFISGTMVTYFFFVEYPKLKQGEAIVKSITGKPGSGANGAPVLPPKVPGTVMEPDPYAQTPAVSDPQKVLTAQPEEAGEIIDLLRTQFINASALISQQLSPDTLNDLLAKYGDKAKISETALMTADPKAKTILQTLSQNNVVYWRPADFSSKEQDNFLKQWDTLKAGNPKGLIIDVRNFRDGNNLAGAAWVIGLFTSPQDVLFSVEGLNFPQQLFRSQHQPLDLKQNFPILVLVNGDTRGAAEALAFVLKQKGTAIVIGRRTAGEGGLFTETRLKSGRFIRLATAQISGFDGSNLLGTPLVPDIQVEVTKQADNEAYYGAYRYGIQNVASARAMDRGLVKEREEMDLPLDNSLIDDKTPHDMILNTANDVLSGITLSQGR